MDILGKFRKVTIDFKRRDVRFNRFGTPATFTRR
jgi:hypothetical protein